MSPSAKTQDRINEAVVTYWEKLGRLNLLNGVNAAENLQREQESHHRNRDAEESYVRRTVWGESQNQQGNKVEDDDMRQTVLGDINYPAPQPSPPQSNLFGWPLVAALLTGGAAGYLLNDSREPEVPRFDDQSVSIGLGRIEDYMKQQPSE